MSLLVEELHTTGSYCSLYELAGLQNGIWGLVQLETGGFSVNEKSCVGEAGV